MRTFVIIALEGSEDELKETKFVLRMIQDFHLLGISYLTAARQVLSLLDSKPKK